MGQERARRPQKQSPDQDLCASSIQPWSRRANRYGHVPPLVRPRPRTTATDTLKEAQVLADQRTVALSPRSRLPVTRALGSRRSASAPDRRPSGGMHPLATLAARRPGAPAAVLEDGMAECFIAELKI